MSSEQSIGAIKVPRMIWTATLLSLGALFICWNSCDKENPTIMDTALEYPYTIIFRVGMMYSLFILFLQSLFIKWWLDSSQQSKHTRKFVILNTIALASYALFVSTIDRKRIDYVLAERAVFVSAITNFFAISLVMSNLSAIRWNDPKFIKFFSWKMKKGLSLIYYGGMSFGFLIYAGQIDIEYKAIAEYVVVISSYLFYWSFVLDFSKYEMDVEQEVKQSVPMYVE